MTNMDSVQINATFLVLYKLKLKAKLFEKNLNKQIKKRIYPTWTSSRMPAKRQKTGAPGSS